MCAKESRILSWQVNHLLVTINNANWSMQSWQTTWQAAKITCGTTISPSCQRRQAWLVSKDRIAASWRTISSKTLQKLRFRKNLACKARRREMGKIGAQTTCQSCRTIRRRWARGWTKCSPSRGSQKVPATLPWKATTSQLITTWLSAQWAHTVILNSSYSHLSIIVSVKKFFRRVLTLTAKRSKEARWIRWWKRPSRPTSFTTHRCANS